MASPSPLGQTAQSSNPWFVVSIGLLCLMVGYGAGSLNLFSETGTGNTQLANNVPVPPTPPTPEQEPEPKDVPPVDPETDHIRGNPDAKVTVIEYSDYECPFCKRHHPTMVQIMDTYGDDVNWVFRHFPLSFHPNAEPGALASECVAELGGNDAFWEFTDTVFEGEGFDFAAAAKSVGVNEAKFKACVDSRKHIQKIQDQMAAGSNSGVNGTPGNIVINHETGETKLISGAVPFSSFQTIIDAMLQS